MGRSSNHAKAELKKGPWTREEDQKLLAYIEKNGHGSWRSLPAKAGLQRCGKSCRLRWTNYLRPDIKRGKFSTQEEKTFIRLHALLGNRWSAIATHLPKRTDNEIKNYWNTRLKKRLTRMGIDPTTHKPKNTNTNSTQSKQAATLSHMAQWETARLEAEARLCQKSKFLSNLHFLRKAAVPPPPPTVLQPTGPPCLDVLKVWQATSRANCFFGSTGSLQSPTSTLNFSDSSSPAVPTVGAGNSFMGNDFVALSNYGEMKGKMENPMQILDHHHEDNIGYSTVDFDYDMMGTTVDLPTDNHNSDIYDMGNGVFGEFEETKNYWNELLNLVTTPMEAPVF